MHPSVLHVNLERHIAYSCLFLGLRIGVDEVSGLFGWEATSLGTCFPTFRNFGNHVPNEVLCSLVTAVQAEGFLELGHSHWGFFSIRSQTPGDPAQWKSDKKWFPFPPLPSRLFGSLHIRPTSPPVLCILLSFVITGYYRNYASACSGPAACYWLPAHHVTLTAAAWKEIQHGAQLLTIGHWPWVEYRNVKLNK